MDSHDEKLLLQKIGIVVLGAISGVAVAAMLYHGWLSPMAEAAL